MHLSMRKIFERKNNKERTEINKLMADLKQEKL